MAHTGNTVPLTRLLGAETPRFAAGYDSWTPLFVAGGLARVPPGDQAEIG